MKKRYIPFFLLLSALYSCNNKPTDHFVLRGTIPGATDSNRNCLVARWKVLPKNSARLYRQRQIRTSRQSGSTHVLPIEHERSRYSWSFWLTNNTVDTWRLTSLSKMENWPSKRLISTACRNLFGDTMSEKKRTTPWQAHRHKRFLPLSTTNDSFAPRHPSVGTTPFERCDPRRV